MFTKKVQCAGIITWNIRACPTSFLTSSSNIVVLHLPNENRLIFFSLKLINFCGTNYGYSSKTTQPLCFSKPLYGYEIFQNVKPALQIFFFKKINFELNLLLISNKAPTLYLLICSEINTVSITNNATVKWKG